MHGRTPGRQQSCGGWIKIIFSATDGRLRSSAKLLTVVAWLSVGGIFCGVSAWISSVRDASLLLLTGTIVNVMLSLVKMCLAQFATHKKALMADAVHGLGDSATELLTVFAHSEASRPPDPEHPWGHGKIESLGAVVITGILLYVAASMAWDSFLSSQAILRSGQIDKTKSEEHEVTAQGAVCSVARMPLEETLSNPTMPAARQTGADCNKQKAACGSGQKKCPAQKAVVAVAVGSILLKEALFRATLITADTAGSKLVQAAAWHHRSDALAAGVALVSQVGASLGKPYFDPLGGGVVAAMLAQSACAGLTESINDLVDYNPASGHEDTSTNCGRFELSRSIIGVQGVRNHTLRTRRMGPYCAIDATIVVDARISASAASMIAEAVHARVIEDFKPFVTDIMVHVDPDGSPQSHHLDTQSESAGIGETLGPQEVDARVREALLALAEERPDLPRITEITELQTYYYTSSSGQTDKGHVPLSSPYIDVKVDIRLAAAAETTIKSASRVAQAARARVFHELSGIVGNVDIDLELDESDITGECERASVQNTAVSRDGCDKSFSSAASVQSHGSWLADFRSATGVRHLQQVTLLWRRGAESRQAQTVPWWLDTVGK
eukprot:CAMPEP_0172725606 /NCGR_PEP_ID=MMETSP1074-20121228/88789_1 /TAXON_ID=2916 /ORGANISM="Ceratium fusus, Strain PA161109" /LENGTH=612 /DNA_ID=CAMNT_0013552415 /DNA_START=35 /DNA_END=1873 /DNA_ORIENTATION=+